VLLPVRLTIPIVVALAGVAVLTEVPSARAAVAPAPDVPPVVADTGRTTMDGVYTLAQATKGRDVFAGSCQSCHTPTQHAGPPFRNKWFGRSLGELYGYIRREMPKNEPGSMSDEDYVRALAYLLRMNGMPTGNVALTADSAALHRIRLDSVRAVPSTPSAR
jgi:mono/diheme cytochrome c family protein